MLRNPKALCMCACVLPLHYHWSPAPDINFTYYYLRPLKYQFIKKSLTNLVDIWKIVNYGNKNEFPNIRRAWNVPVLM